MSPRAPDAYDFIVVGGGAAGCVLARRLIDAGEVSVLLIEAGPRDRHPLIHMPAGFARMTGPRFGWGYETVPQAGLGGRRVWFPQGRVLGGGSSVNAQIYTRGNRWDYDHWAAEGCTGWSYDEVLPYFRRAEDNDRLADAYHGTGGPLAVSDALPHPLTRAYVLAAQQAGLPFNADFNGARQEGVGFYQVTNRAGRRVSAARGYLRPVLGSERLTLMTGTAAARIEIAGGRARAVHVAEGGGLRRIEARREVLLAAGAIGSPKLLMLSGVGPAADLSRLGIEPALDLPGVGRNLQDHLDLFAIAECSADHSADRFKPPHMTALAGLQYLMFRTGIVASNICDGGGFCYADETAPAPDVQLHFLPGSGLEAGVERIRNGVTLNSALLRPRSRGRVTLASADPAAPPLIDPAYWADPYDVTHSIRAFRTLRRILAQPCAAPLHPCRDAPGARGRASDDDLRAYACKHAKSDYHPVGTCRMGAPGAPGTVVTPNLRVAGVEGLRVCDSSVMPFLPSCNTNAPTIMIAERAAEMVRADHGLAPHAASEAG